MLTVTPVFAQAAIQQLGAYAFYHPNSDRGLGINDPRPRESTGVVAAAPLQARNLEAGREVAALSGPQQISGSQFFTGLE